LIHEATGFDLEVNELRGKLFRLMEPTFKNCAKIWIIRGILDQEVIIRIKDLIEKNPIKASKLMGIKEIAYVNEKYEIDLYWSFAWRIFYCYKDKKDYLLKEDDYFTVHTKMGMIIGNPLLSDIKIAELQDAFITTLPLELNRFLVALFGYKTIFEDEKKRVKELMDKYTSIPTIFRIKILEDVFYTVKEAGFNQADHILKLIRELPY
jgi:hypothetical protein